MAGARVAAMLNTRHGAAREHGSPAQRGPAGGGAMPPPKRRSISRRDFVAALAAVGAAVGADVLSARMAEAAPWSEGAPVAALDATARTADSRADQKAHIVHRKGSTTMIDQMTSVAQATAIRPFVVDFPDADLDDLR